MSLTHILAFVNTGNWAISVTSHVG